MYVQIPGWFYTAKYVLSAFNGGEQTSRSTLEKQKEEKMKVGRPVRQHADLVADSCMGSSDPGACKPSHAHRLTSKAWTS